MDQTRAARALDLPAAKRQVFLSRSRSNVLADIVPFLCRRVRAQVCKIVMIPCAIRCFRWIEQINCVNVYVFCTRVKTFSRIILARIERAKKVRFC